MNDLDRLALGCISPSFPGPEAPAWILRRLERGVGGICLFAYNVADLEQLGRLTERLRSERPELVIGIDEEGGDVTRLEARPGSSFPGNAALGAVDDTALTEAVAAAIGGELAAAGINLDYAPVADVNVDPANPVIGVRSFGHDPDLVARHVAAFVTGLQSRGVAACAKHFPGHGATEQDSHLDLPVIAGDPRAGLEPFRAAIGAGVQAIMTAHVRMPTLDDLPATLSRTIVGDLLRDELGFDGLVIADALEMKAVSDTTGVPRSAVLAIAAGVDLLLVGHDLGETAVDAIQQALVAAVQAGELTEARLREAAGRTAAVGRWALDDGSRTRREPEPALGLDAARRALSTVGEIGLTAAPLVVELRPRANIAAGEARHSLGAVLAGRLPGTRSIVVDDASAERGEALRIREGRPLVIVVRDAHRYPWMRSAATALLAAAPGSVLVELGLPVWRPASVHGYAATFGGSRASYEALAERLTGGVAV